MRLRRLDLTRYGRFTDRVLAFGDAAPGRPDLHIVYGPNEAGKSTAFNAFLDLLFGIEMQSRYNFLHPYAAMQVGGSLDLSDGVRELVRVKRQSASLLDPGGHAVPEGLIGAELGGMDRAAYRTMFSLDDETLETGGNSILASNGELGQLLFSASAGLAELSQTLVALRHDTDEFHKLRGRSGELTRLKAELARLKDERDAIDTLASDYNRLAAARDDAAARYDAAAAEQARARTALEDTRRLLAALPLLATLREMEGRLGAGPDLPPAPPGWLDELPALEAAETRHGGEVRLAQAEVERLAHELAALAQDDPASRSAGRLPRLAQLRARHYTAELDLPARRQELARQETELTRLLTRIDRPDELEPTRLALTATQDTALARLMASRSGIAATRAAARDEQEDAAAVLAEARHAADAAGAGDGRSLAAVAEALAAWRASDHAARLRTATRQHRELAAVLAGQVQALAPWTGDAGSLAAVTVPEAADLRAWQAQADRDDALAERRATELEAAEEALHRRRAEESGSRPTDDMTPDEAAAALRQAREAAWAAHRRSLDAATADGFEAALRRDDLAGTARLGQERALARHAEAAQAVVLAEAEVTRARSAATAAAAQAAGNAGRVARAAGAAGLPDDTSVAGLLAWAARRIEALDRATLRDAAGRDEAAATADGAALERSLRRALEVAGVPCDADPVPAAQAALDGEARQHRLAQAAEEAARDLRKRDGALSRAVRTEADWCIAWRAACAACWLGEASASLPVETVREMLDVAREIGTLLKAMGTLAERIASMEDDQAELRKELAHLLPALGIVPGPADGPLDLADAVAAQVERAGRLSDERERLAAALDAARTRHRQATEAARQHAERAAHMMDVMDAPSLLALSGRLRDAAERADWHRRAEAARRDLLATLHVATVEAAAARLADQDAAALDRLHAGLAADTEGLDARTRDLFAARCTAEDRIAQVGGDDAAARLEARRRVVLMDVTDKAGHWLRLRAGIAGADRALRTYRDRHRSGMMRGASDAFRLISRGAYSGLGTQPERDGEVLVALPASGGSKLARDLSKGTRFQLYLALRVAGYREFARQRRPVPFIADDIMETFDDGRTEETLRVLADMAGLGQVIYLTHHEHVRAIAERTVPGVQVHRLDGQP